jgi:hypothetical protein
MQVQLYTKPTKDMSHLDDFYTYGRLVEDIRRAAMATRCDACVVHREVISCRE